jgi:TonB family protein
MHAFQGSAKRVTLPYNDEMRSAKSIVSSAFVLLAAVLSVPAAADLVSASNAYAKGDYDRAFADFRELAQLGQPTAQYNLAVMYAEGQGTRQSDIYAYAWASLAAGNGLEKAKSLAEALRPRLAPGSEKIAADIEAEYANAVLDARLNPRMVESVDEQATTKRCFPVHAYIPAYPSEAQSRGAEGQVYVEFSLMPDGRSRNPRIIYAVPQGLFEPAVRTALLHSEFGAGAAGEKPVQCTLFYRFVVSGMTASNYPTLQRYVDDTLAKAKGGDPRAQMLYGMLLVGLPQLNKPRSTALPWFLKSAQAGIPVAQYQVGYSLLKGWGCDCEVNKGLDWLRRAAQAGQPDAEVTLAMYALKGTPDEERSRQAKLWLEQACASGSHDGKLYLAALLAAAPDATTRDPRRALELLGEVFPGVNDDPTAFEIRAAAHASAGQFDDAVKSERSALHMARALKWDLAPLNARLSQYVAKQPWYGNLLEF